MRALADAETRHGRCPEIRQAHLYVAGATVRPRHPAGQKPALKIPTGERPEIWNCALTVQLRRTSQSGGTTGAKIGIGGVGTSGVLCVHNTLGRGGAFAARKP
jgi:hypothetical protein